MQPWRQPWRRGLALAKIAIPASSWASMPHSCGLASWSQLWSLCVQTVNTTLVLETVQIVTADFCPLVFFQRPLLLTSFHCDISFDLFKFMDSATLVRNSYLQLLAEMLLSHLISTGRHLSFVRPCTNQLFFQSEQALRECSTTTTTSTILPPSGCCPGPPR